MADSVWEKLLKEITDPWDWVAAGAGALGGAGVTAATHGLDMGHSVGAGALAGVTARKTLKASLTKRQLRKRAEGFHRELKKAIATFPPPLVQVLHKLEIEIDLWRSGATTNQQFEKALDLLIDEYRKLVP